MGNNIKYNNNDLTKNINLIATNLILSQSFKDIINIKNVNYYNKLLKLTSKNIKKYLNNDNIHKLSKELKINTNQNNNNLSIEISKYYIKILNIFNSIVIMNSCFFNKNKNKNFYDLKFILENFLFDDLKNLYIDIFDDDDVVYCNSKIIYDHDLFNDLEKSYFDVYDYEKEEFNNMSNDMKKIYKNDLNNLYTIIHNKKSNIEINSFKDISLLNLNNFSNTSEMYKKIYAKNNKNKLFSQYIDNIKNMKQNIQEKQVKLINIINNIFMIKDSEITINNNLNIDKLNVLIIHTKNIIMDIYANYDKYYNKGILIYDTIIENIKLDTNYKKIENIKKNIELLNSNQNI